MGSYPDEFPFNIMDVVELLRLRVRRQQSNSVYVDCPFCGDRRGKMNVNFVKNVWRCNYCGEHGGMLGLYARLNNTTTSDAYWEIAEALCDNCHEEHIRSGNEAPKLGGQHRVLVFGARLTPAVILLPSEKLCRSQRKQVLRRSTRRYPCCWPSLHCDRLIGSIFGHQSVGYLMNKSNRWALRAPRRPFCAALLQRV